MERAKEVGVRKVLGAVHSGLIRQFLSESILIAVISRNYRCVTCSVRAAADQRKSGKDFSSTHLFSTQMLVWIIVFTVITGLFAGIYPAWFLSRFKRCLC
jgi:putative ABC transport system permease protein